MICKKCNNVIADGTEFCPFCGEPTGYNNANPNGAYGYSQPGYNQPGYTPYYTEPTTAAPTEKPRARGTRLATGVLAFTLGAAFGAHDYYIGKNSLGLAHILVFFLGSIVCGIGPVVSAIWSIVEGVKAFKGTLTDGNGVLIDD